MIARIKPTPLVSLQPIVVQTTWSASMTMATRLTTALQEKPRPSRLQSVRLPKTLAELLCLPKTFSTRTTWKQSLASSLLVNDFQKTSNHKNSNNDVLGPKVTFYFIQNDLPKLYTFTEICKITLPKKNIDMLSFIDEVNKLHMISSMHKGLCIKSSSNKSQYRCRTISLEFVKDKTSNKRKLD